MTPSLPYHTPLTPDQQTAAGCVRPWTLALADRVRLSELDPLNHVNNVAYLVWFETARVAYFKHIGLTTYTRPDAEPRIVIRRGTVDWLREIRGDEDYVVTAQTVAFRKTSFTMQQEIRAAGAVRATFECVVVLLTPDGTSRQAIPEEITNYFQNIEVASSSNA